VWAPSRSDTRRYRCGGSGGAALPARKRTEAQLRRSFVPLAVHLPSEVKRSRKRFVQRHRRGWNRANPTPLTWEVERTLTAAFMKADGRGVPTGTAMRRRGAD
jgi:hypothetical protein